MSVSNRRWSLNQLITFSTNARGKKHSFVSIICSEPVGCVIHNLFGTLTNTLTTVKLYSETSLLYIKNVKLGDGGD